MQGTMPGARRRARPRTAWIDNIKTWTGLSVEESIRMTEINGESTSMVWPTLGSRMAKEQNRCGFVTKLVLTVVYKLTRFRPTESRSKEASCPVRSAERRVT